MISPGPTTVLGLLGETLTGMGWWRVLLWSWEPHMVH